ncbi:MAG: helix-turn-helix transcriptional regulator [Lachnospiraceae bacterium]|nr:helix-turn-helix transcriptional regulator [Lachnospiraceae bacterium]
MFHRALHIEFKEGTSFELTFQTGEVKRYDVAALYAKYPQMRALEDRTLFLAGKLTGAYGIIWNDELDLEAETVYEDGETVRIESLPANMKAANAVWEARAAAGISQKDLSASSGIDQSDISRIERGMANPSVQTLDRIAEAMGMELNISILKDE